MMLRLGLIVFSLASASFCALAHPNERTEEYFPLINNASSIFNSNHVDAFLCSPIEKVSCEGLFPPRPAIQNEVAVLENGEQSFFARINSIRAAKTSIRIQSYIFKGDDAGQMIAEELLKKHNEGVKVTIIIDAIGNLNKDSRKLFLDLKQEGVKILGYEGGGYQFQLEVNPYDNGYFHHRYHEKMWIVDGETRDGLAIVGGLNIGNEYFRTGPSHTLRFRDQDVAFKGSAVRDAVTAFDQNVEFFEGIKSRVPDQFNPDQYWHYKRLVFKKRKIKYSRLAKAREKLEEHLKQDYAINFHPANLRLFQSSPRMAENYITQAYLRLIREASEDITIQNSYFIPTVEFRDAFKDALLRGVRIRILTNSLAVTDLPIVSYAGRTYYHELLSWNKLPEVIEAGGEISVYEWHGKRPNETLEDDHSLHSKFMTVDGINAFVGSYNLDPRSDLFNSESGVAIQSTQIATQLNELFEKDLKRSELIDMQTALEFLNPSKRSYRAKMKRAKKLERYL